MLQEPEQLSKGALLDSLPEPFQQRPQRMLQARRMEGRGHRKESGCGGRSKASGWLCVRWPLWAGACLPLPFPSIRKHTPPGHSLVGSAPAREALVPELYCKEPPRFPPHIAPSLRLVPACSSSPPPSCLPGFALFRAALQGFFCPLSSLSIYSLPSLYNRAAPHYRLLICSPQD